MHALAIESDSSDYRGFELMQFRLTGLLYNSFTCWPCYYLSMLMHDSLISFGVFLLFVLLLLIVLLLFLSC